jgi:hypothetical protein
MAESSFFGEVYRLRASAPMPITSGRLVLHTFGAELNSIEIIECTQTLPGSDQFRGQGLDNPLVSANFSRIGDKDGHFQGRKVYTPSYIDETDLQFNF